jgi:hypothetical protein
VLSVKANPACADEGAAEKAVNEVWESCFKDTRPFDEVGFCFLVLFSLSLSLSGSAPSWLGTDTEF